MRGIGAFRIQRFGYGTHALDGKFILDIAGNIFQIFAVFFGDENIFHTGGKSADQFFPQSADGGDIAAQSDLSGHSQFFDQRLAAYQRSQRQSHGDTG